MPSPWSPGDNVQVRVGEIAEAGVWCNAVVDLVMAPGVYCCTITDDPLPTLAECGKTHWATPNTQRINATCVAKEASNTINNAEDTIRDPI